MVFLAGNGNHLEGNGFIYVGHNLQLSGISELSGVSLSHLIHHNYLIYGLTYALVHLENKCNNYYQQYTAHNLNFDTLLFTCREHNYDKDKSVQLTDIIFIH